ncbi:WhiB family transcriptional regulator [Actinomadura viridis]|uniref:WhiB family transcriptional regulator n=1 Tax=Actinomadura viridis TaxID=58110 RepID=UPI003690A243
MVAIHWRSNSRSRHLTVGEGQPFTSPKAPASLDWQADALCREVGTDLFFEDGDGPSQQRAAKQVCAACPVRDACLQWALTFPAFEDMHGVFGGTSPQDRRRIRSERQAVAA